MITDEEWKKVDIGTKVQISKTKEIRTVIGFAYIDDNNPGYTLLLDNNKIYTVDECDIVN